MIDPESTILAAAEARWPTERTIPQPIINGLTRYANHRVRTGGFLLAVLSNDLFNAVARADADSLRHLRDICVYIESNLPPQCWGSPARVEAWTRGGAG